MKNLLLVWHCGKQKTWKRGWCNACWWPYCIAWRWRVPPHNFCPKHLWLSHNNSFWKLNTFWSRWLVKGKEVGIHNAGADEPRNVSPLVAVTGLVLCVALKTPAVPLSMKLYESKQICGNCILLTCNKNNSSWYISDLYFSHFFFCCCQSDD